MAKYILYTNILKAFVKTHSRNKQRGSDWYASMGTTVGGSEIAAIMGLNKYMSFNAVVKNKVSILNGTHVWTGGEACWWGSLFEGVISAVVEADFQSVLIGDEICIQKYPGHRTSPDGFMVIKVDSNGNIVFGPASDYRIAMFEFKCPHTRQVDGEIPICYEPQVLSGLDVSPIAHFGIFVDAVFRKCAFEDLNDGPAYDKEYHHRDGTQIRYPQYYGLIGLYSSAPEKYRREDLIEGVSVVDYGAKYAPFKYCLRLIDTKELKTEIIITTDAEESLRDLKALEEPNHMLIGIIPWKLLEVHYKIIERKKDFILNLMPLIDSVHAAVKSHVQRADNDK